MLITASCKRTFFLDVGRLLLTIGYIVLVSGSIPQPSDPREGLSGGAAVDTLRGTTPYGNYVIIRTDTSFSGRVLNGAATVGGRRWADTLELQRVTIGLAQFGTRQRYLAQSPRWETELHSISYTAHSLARAKQKLERAGWSLPSSVLDFAAEVLPGETNPVCQPPVGFPLRFEFFGGNLTGSFTIYPGCIAIVMAGASTEFTDVEVSDGGALLSFSPGDVLDAHINANSVDIRGTVVIDGDVRADRIRLDGSLSSASLTAGEAVVRDRMEVINGSVDLSGTLRARRSFLSGGNARSIALRQNSTLSAGALDAESFSAENSQINISLNAKADILSLSSSRARVALDLESLHLRANNCPSISVGSLRVSRDPQLQLSGRAELTSSTLAIAADGEVPELILDSVTITRSNLLSTGTFRANRSTVNTSVLRTDALTAEDCQFNLDMSLTSGSRPARVSLDTCSVFVVQIDVGTFDASRTLVRTPLAAADRPLMLTADTLLTDRVRILARDSTRINVARRSRLTNTHVPTKRIHATLGNAHIGTGTHFDTDEGGGSPRWGLVHDELEAGGRTPTYTGASYGGYGGTFGALNQRFFIPADEPIGSPNFAEHELREGLGGYPAINPSWSNYNTEGGKGGGVIRIDASDLVLDGVVSANGGTGTVQGWRINRTRQGAAMGGGSGGTILINVGGNLSGSGRIEANGGKGKFGFGPWETGSGGSGGRIRINYASTVGWSGSVKALGGEGGWFEPEEMRVNVQAYPTMIPPWADSVINGGPGTIYWKHSSGIGKILIDGRGGLRGGAGRIGGEFLMDTIEVCGALAVTNFLKARALVLRDSAIIKPDNPYVRLIWPIPRRYRVPVGYGLRTDLSTTLNYYPDAVWKDSLQEVTRLEIQADIFIDPTSRIELSGFGKFGQEWTTTGYAGGSHGGYGGFGARWNPPREFGRASMPYGDPLEPLSFGEGGMGEVGYRSHVTPSHYLHQFGGSGGGVLRIVSGGKLHVDGEIRSDGIAGSGDISGANEGTGGGAGGSIWLTVQSLAGNGVISASGGDGVYDAFRTQYGGGGSGGRIRIDYADKSMWNGRVLTVGGRGGKEATHWSDPRNNGGPGTVVWNLSGGTRTIEINDREGNRGLGFLSGIFTGTDVEIRAAVVATDGLSVRYLALRDSAILTGNDYRTGLKLFPAGAFPTVPFPVWGERVDRRVQIRSTGNISIDNSSILDLSGLGFYGRTSNRMPGGSYGGRGGTGAYQTTLGSPTPTYGDSLVPLMSGLGGYGEYSAIITADERITLNGAGASGGGALRVLVDGMLQVDGQILANGESAIPQERGGVYGAGGGAGGSVLIRAGSVAGSGTISASGGSGVFIPSSSLRIWGGGGGGGRVAVYGNLTSFSGRLRADGGDGGSGGGIGPEVYRGQRGTVVTGLVEPQQSGPLTLLRATPASGDTGVSRTAPVRLVFSRSVDVSTFTFTCQPDPGGWSVHWNITSDTLALQHSRFDSATTYMFTITSARDFAGNAVTSAGVPLRWHFSTGRVVTSVTEDAGVPKKFALLQNYPNPFNSSTIIEYHVPTASHVVLKISDILGREVATLVDDFQMPAQYKVTFHASGLSSGVYFYRLSAGSYQNVKKLVIVQ